MAVLVVALEACRDEAGERVTEARAPEWRLIREVPLPESRFAPIIAWGSDSTIVVADEAEQQVVITHLDTGASTRLGSRGPGPAEFRRIVGLAATGAGELVVADARARYLTLLGPDRGMRGTVPLPEAPIQLLAFPDSAVSVVVQERLPRSERGPVLYEVDVPQLRLGRRVAFAERDSQLPMGMKPPVHTFAVAADRRGLLHVASNARYRVSVIDGDGTLRRTYGREDLPAPRLPPEEFDRRLEEGKRALRAAGHSDVMPDSIVESIRNQALPYFFPPGFAVDGSGRLWVVTYPMRTDFTTLDLFAADGTYLGARRVPGELRAMAFRGDSLAVLMRRTDPVSGDQSFAVALFEVE